MTFDIHEHEKREFYVNRSFMSLLVAQATTTAERLKLWIFESDLSAFKFQVCYRLNGRLNHLEPPLPHL